MSDAGLTPQAAAHADRGVSDTQSGAGFISKQVSAAHALPSLRHCPPKPASVLLRAGRPWLTARALLITLQTPLEMRTGEADRLPAGALGGEGERCVPPTEGGYCTAGNWLVQAASQSGILCR